MRAEKSNFAVYSSSSRSDSFSRSSDVLHLIRRNKEEEKKEKIRKIYIFLLGLAGLFLFLGILIYYL